MHTEVLPARYSKCESENVPFARGDEFEDPRREQTRRGGGAEWGRDGERRDTSIINVIGTVDAFGDGGCNP